MYRLRRTHPPTLETDDRGQLSIKLKAGGYALFVSAQGFKKDTRHIDISIPEDKASARQIVPVVLEVALGGGVTVYPTAVDGSLVLTADPYHAPVALSPADFRAWPHVTIKARNGHTNAAETYSGVLLATLLAKVNAPLGQELHGEAMATYVTATGSNGYAVALSLAQVDPSFHEGHVLVADARDGQPLGKSGPFQLIVSEDKRPARWVGTWYRLPCSALRKRFSTNKRSCTLSLKLNWNRGCANASPLRRSGQAVNQQLRAF
ncbi:MAG: hypothetical protein ABSF15_21240 [Candidatus Sulfotelmatobacter sp.]